MAKNPKRQSVISKPNVRALEQALAHLRENKPNIALTVLKDILRKNSHDTELLNLAGISAAMCGLTTDAEAYWTRAVTTDSNSFQAYGNLGKLYAGMQRFDKAEQCLKASLRIAPDYVDANCNLGTLYKERNQWAEAEACYMQVLNIQPEHLTARYNLAHLYQIQYLFPKAETEYLKLLAHTPEHIDGLYNLSRLYESTSRPEAAVGAFRRILAIDNAHQDTLMSFGNLLAGVGNLKEAVACFRHCVERHPEFSGAYVNLGNNLRNLGEVDAAASAYESALRLNPDNQYVSHMLAILRGLNTERATDNYVASVFDEYAEKFESSLVGQLNYQTPALIGQRLKSMTSTPHPLWDVLDLGCGTGLVGIELAPLAKNLVGIDLSGKMLEQARLKNVYHRLVKDELLVALAREKNSSFDVVVSSDVFVYIGNLAATFDAIYKVLTEGGLFAYSVEGLFPVNGEATEVLPNYRLNKTGRYSQSLSYIQSLANPERFVLCEVQQEQIRSENGLPVYGYVVLMQKKTQNSVVQ